MQQQLEKLTGKGPGEKGMRGRGRERSGTGQVGKELEREGEKRME